MPITPRLECALQFKGPELQRCVVVLQYEPSQAPADYDEFDTWGIDLELQWGTDAKPVIPTECAWAGIELRYISAGISYFAPFAANGGPGTVTGDTLPAEMAVLFQKYGAGPAKRANGLVYWPCVPAAYVNSTLINGTGQAAYAAITNQLVATVNSGQGTNLVPVVMSRAAQTLYPIQRADLMGTASQRRRRPE